MPNPVFNVREMSDGEDQNALERPSAMEAFKERVNKFWATYKQMESRHDEVPAPLKPEYDSLMEKGGRIRATIESITNTYDAAAEWIGDVFSFDGFGGVDKLRWSDAFSGQFGALPFIPLAVIAASSTFIVKWLKDAYTMERKLNEMKRLEDQGYDSQRAAQIVNKTITGPGLLNINANMKPLMIVGGIGIGFFIAKRQGWI